MAAGASGIAITTCSSEDDLGISDPTRNAVNTSKPHSQTMLSIASDTAPIRKDVEPKKEQGPLLDQLGAMAANPQVRETVDNVSKYFGDRCV